MLIAGESVRLTEQERGFLTALSRSDPSYIKTTCQLTLFVQALLTLYAGPSPEERTLRGLLSTFLPPEQNA